MTPAPLSMGFSKQEYWSGLSFPPPGNLPDPRIEPRSPALQTDALPSEIPGKPSPTRRDTKTLATFVKRSMYYSYNQKKMEGFLKKWWGPWHSQSSILIARFPSCAEPFRPGFQLLPVCYQHPRNPTGSLLEISCSHVPCFKHTHHLHPFHPTPTCSFSSSPPQ